MHFYAHTKNDQDGNPRPTSEWEPLFSEDCATLSGGICEKCQRLEAQHGHLNKVAYLAGKFAAEMFPEGHDRVTAKEWGFLAGIWHDLGKFAPEWQKYLQNKVDPHRDEIAGKVDHSTAGAQYSVRSHPLFGHILAFAIAAHHCGLLDTNSQGANTQENRLRKDLPKVSALHESIQTLKIPAFPPFLMERMTADRGTFSTPLFTRLLFSCLVDADFLATEAFMTPGAAAIRNAIPPDALKQISHLVTRRIQSFGDPAPDDSVNLQRAQVVRDCFHAASMPPGLFTLSVPTGGGKTLSSLHFAVNHALQHKQRRIIYVAPFTSIIEQNATIIREIVATIESETFTPVIEHHSSLSPDEESEQSRLATENWDAPIVVTTAVQFFESLFAAKTSRSRKLHNIANAVVILDEAQSLPVNFLAPCLATLQELCDHYNTTAVLCTATQPAIKFDAAEFPIGLRGCREIIQDPAHLFSTLKRVEIQNLGKCSDADLIERIQTHESVLCIVNRRKHAQELFQLLPESEDHFHLSALMCPEHRSQILAEVRQKLDQGKAVRLISTQLIEAGVDVDFPVVFRALAGIDSIAQAAGRCNRNGKQQTLGKTYIFSPEDDTAEAYFRETAQIGTQVISLHENLLSPEAVHHYFDLYYYQQKSRWDEKGILDNFRYDGRKEFKHCPFRFDFRKTSEDFQLINDWQKTVIIPYDQRARELIRHLGNERIPLNRKLLRSLQRYTVQISPKLLCQNQAAFESIREGEFHALISPELNYSSSFGLTLDEDHSAGQFLGVCK